MPITVDLEFSYAQLDIDLHFRGPCDGLSWNSIYKRLLNTASELLFQQAVRRILTSTMESEP